MFLVSSIVIDMQEIERNWFWWPQFNELALLQRMCFRFLLRNQTLISKSTMYTTAFDFHYSAPTGASA